MLNSEELINKVKIYNKFLNPEKLNKAYNFALDAHQHQKREEGPLVHCKGPCPVPSSELFRSADVFNGIIIDDVVDVDTPGRGNHPRNSTED